MPDKASLTERIENALAGLAPVWAERRQRARHVREVRERQHQRLMERQFDGADDNRLRGDRWLKSQLSPDSTLEQDLQDLRTRTRELYRSFPYLTGAIDHRTDNVVGTGIRPQARIKALDGVVSEADAERHNSELEGIWKRWAPYAGRGGRQSFTQLTRLGHRCWRRDGDCLLVRSAVQRADKPIPLQLDLVVAERIETPAGQDPRIRLGVEKTDSGEIVQYHVRRTHPHDSYDNGPTYDRFPADRACLLMEELWPDQSRGLPWAFSILSEARDFSDYKEAVSIAAQVAACQMTHVATDNPDLLARNSVNSAGEQEMQPGQVVYHDLATTITHVNPNYPNTTYGMFAEWGLLGMAAGLNYPFGWFVKDRRRATYSAGRLEEIDGGVPLRCDFVTLRSCWLTPTWHWFVDECVALGLTTIDPVKYRRFPWVYRDCIWIPPGRQWVDPETEVAAAIAAKNHNLGTMTDVLGLKGLDLEETFAIRERERRLEREKGIVPPEQEAAELKAAAAAAAKPPPADDDEES